MTDHSIPVGDQEWPAETIASGGPAMARQALDRTTPRFADQVVDRARLLGWRVFVLGPHHLMFKGGTLVIAHVGIARGFQVDELLASVRRTTRIVGAHFDPRQGLAPVDAVLGAGPPAGEPDHGRRGD